MHHKPVAARQDGKAWKQHFAGDLNTSQARFRRMAEIVLKHAPAHLLNHASYGMSVFMETECGVNCEWLPKELEEERQRIDRRSGFRIVNHNAS